MDNPTPSEEGVMERFKERLLAAADPIRREALKRGIKNDNAGVSETLRGGFRLNSKRIFEYTGFIVERVTGTDTPRVVQFWRERNTRSPLVIAAEVADHPTRGQLLHIQLTYAEMSPAWIDIWLIRETLCPKDMEMMVLMPQGGGTFDAYVRHLWELPSGW